MNRRFPALTTAAIVVFVVAALVIATAPTILISSYDTTTVEATDAETGETLATVEARIADGPMKRYVGLSTTDELADDEGMLFVHGESGEHDYVMRDMAFAIDIVFVAADGEITEIREAEPESRPLTTYEGTGQYVLEVPRGWSADNGVEPGDSLEFELP
ncbi:hypothetical protein SAMN04488066_10370 [Halorubrum aquaticum]|uniref:DUF192 domain-containing protein n=1 Tax=Halorubrum aquaticum TaxID=387340 RepID=A0A1I2ZS25_9EURY|nr:DUF192 domain-containing protein [Halorubrum aquaticum]SFH40647.1 hypothetical protein SAMN04488066_10370 [Halorubrum aquaticum]